MGRLKYILGIVLFTMSFFSIILCLIRGKGALHKKLTIFALMSATVAMICFGGNIILSCFGMGWRCTPFNIMLFLCSALFVPTLWYSMHELSTLEDNTNHILIVSGFFSITLMLITTLIFLFIYFNIFSWHDKLSNYEGQTIVCANNMHGGSGHWRYYTHINNLVHGTEIQRSWPGTTPS